MRMLHSVLAFFLLLQSGFAAACHSVGDVHVICHDDGIKLVYSETQSPIRAQNPIAAQNMDAPCCSALSLADAATPPLIAPGIAVLPAAQKHTATPSPRETAFTPPKRGPPSLSAL